MVNGNSNDKAMLAELIYHVPNCRPEGKEPNNSHYTHHIGRIMEILTASYLAPKEAGVATMHMIRATESISPLVKVALFESSSMFPCLQNIYSIAHWRVGDSRGSSAGLL